MRPTAVILSLASDYGCQVQISNFPEILEMLSTFDLGYWQFVSSGDMPDAYEVALIEGAVTTDEHVELLEKVRATASCVIALGACAATGGIPGLAIAGPVRGQLKEVYGSGEKKVGAGARKPAPISDYITVDFTIPGCPIDPAELSRVLQRAIRALVDTPQRQSMCGECKIAENMCFWLAGTPCLGMIARSGCNATCVSRGRPCTACRGIAQDANIESAYAFAAQNKCDADQFESLIKIYNAANEQATQKAVTSKKTAQEVVS
ncbi:MAG: NADH:ubiquinone oxidoreductase [Coriobacteriia bacterium]|nr:NADH:ubiquinone oxidoreductase [Coriobacteriia bacterium]